MSDDARQVAFDPRAPADERRDAQAELTKAAMPSARALIPAEQIISMFKEVEGWGELNKAHSEIIPYPGTDRKKPGTRGMASVYLDNLQAYQMGDYYEKNSDMGFDQLRMMFDQTPVLNSVILTRQHQVARFCQPSEDGGPGFEIRHRSKTHKMSADEIQAKELLTMFFQNCGWEFNPRRRKQMKRDNFTQFMMRSVGDSLALDSAPIETEMKRNRNLGIDGFYAVDGATIRLCTDEGYEGDDEIFALQVVQSRVSTCYTHDQLIYEVRNPRTDVRRAGYGYSEAEGLIRVVTGLLNAMTYNINGFDQNAIPKGLLHLTGDYGQEDLVAFKRYWNQMVKGINNAWSLPVLVAKDGEGKATFEKFGVEFNEMFFAKWMTFLVSIICAVYGMAPEEINFQGFADGKSSLSGSDTSEKLANSKDSGLRPLMAYYESMLTDFIVTEFDQNLCFRWCGLEEQDEDKLLEREKLTLTVDEMRKKIGYEPDPKYGGAPLNPALVSVWTAENMPEPPAPATPEQDFGSPPADGAPASDSPMMGHNGGPPLAGSDPAPPPGKDVPEAGQPPDGEFGKALTLFSVWALEA